LPQFAVNHMTVARLGYTELLDLAASLGCVGVEVRDDLGKPLFDGLDPVTAGAMARDRGLRILALAEVKRFNDWSEGKSREARELMGIAVACGAEAVSLIPRNDNGGMGNGERQGALRVALKALRPMLEDHDLIGLVEPLGFLACPLRIKADTVEVIEALGAGDRFRIVHDTFHHHLAHHHLSGGGPIFAGHTGIVHVSGVVDPRLSVDEMGDRHRVLVDGADRLDNLGQLWALEAAGYRGPVSFEAFAPETQAEPDPAAALRRSMEFIRSRLAAQAA